MTGPVVIDASVGIKWYLKDDEENLAEAQVLLDSLGPFGLKGYIPSHFFVEVGSTLYRKKPEMASEWVAELLDLYVQVFSLRPSLLSISDRLLKKYDALVFYDVLYHALALETGATLVTADQKYYERAKKEGHVILLRDFF